MDKNKVNEIIKKARRKTAITGVIFIFLSIALLMFCSGITYAILVVLLMAVFVIVIGKINSFNYIIYKLHDPELYYYVYLGTHKKEPPTEFKRQVAELMGDYETALQIANYQLGKAKNNLVKYSSLVDIVRISFYAGDYELTQKAINDAMALSVSKNKISTYSQWCFDFYNAFISGDYQLAKEHFAKIKTPIKKEIKTSDCQMAYLEGLLEEALGNINVANEKFNFVIRNAPKLYVSTLAQKHINGELEIASCDLLNANQASYQEPKDKKEWWRILIFFLALIVLVWSGATGDIFGFNDSQATVESAFEEYVDNGIFDISDVLYQFKPDEMHTIAVALDSDNELSVGYLKNKDNEYICKSIASYTKEDIERGDINDFLSVSGKSRKLIYSINKDKSKIPNGYEIVEIDYNSQKLYFGYKLDDLKRHFVDSAGISIYDDEGNQLL